MRSLVRRAWRLRPRSMKIVPTLATRRPSTGHPAMSAFATEIPGATV
jgi:hypothetical protein